MLTKTQIDKLTGDELERQHQESVRQEVEKNPWFWLTHYVYTYDPAQMDNPEHKFPDTPYLKVLVDLWMEGRLLFIRKSFQMLTSWLFVALHLWDVAYHPGRYCLIQSSKQTKAGFGGVDSKESQISGTPLSLLGRADYIYQRLPPFLQIPRVKGKEPPMLKFLHYIGGRENPSFMQGVSSVGDEARQTNFTGCLMDEAAFQPEAFESFTAIVPRLAPKGRLTVVSTVNGRDGFFYPKIWDRTSSMGDEIRQTDLPKVIPEFGYKVAVNAEEIFEGIWAWKNPGNKIKVMSLHYMADPEKRSKEWREFRQEGLAHSQWRKEAEMDEDIEGDQKGIFKDTFITQKHIKPGTFDRAYPLLWSFDWGRNNPACVFIQIVNGQVRILKEIQGVDIILRRFILEQVLPIKDRFFPSVPVSAIEGVGDISGNSKNERDDLTNFQLLDSIGIKLAANKFYIRPGIYLIEAKLNQKIGDEPGLIVDPGCSMLIDGFTGGYRWDKNGQEPEKNIYSHSMDCVRYLLCHNFHISEVHDTEVSKEQPPRTKEEIIKTMMLDADRQDKELVESNSETEFY